MEKNPYKERCAAACVSYTACKDSLGVPHIMHSIRLGNRCYDRVESQTRPILPISRPIR